MRNSSETARRLFDIADAQQGFFTTKQAKKAGYYDESIAYHVRAGNWIREHRGIYRLANYPLVERADLMPWYLWSQNRAEEPQGVYSHQTALSLYDLSDVNPNRLHMTVPPGFRRTGTIPGILVLHRAAVDPSSFRDMFGVRVTTPLRTVCDIVGEEGLSEDLQQQAIADAIRRGLITRRELQRVAEKHDRLSELSKGILP